ncbi:hypothetical protein V492_01880 [Pseudogymnoascus sp. VKM F-4246]|nr:hypothetical protein V492_01880 [Pseudogymnoascus sp. VKM F-4246]KFY33754.1 hypothetical protein V494_07361 [Pseudogymnoascus sp. VKM F-4513 (FW-928)]
MVKALSFKGDPKTKKRKRVDTAAKFGEASKELTTDAAGPVEDTPASDDSWVSAEATTDIEGPIVFVLPSEPPTCIACDTNGQVFASPLENIIDGDPSTAEPHDVRQVWVASRVAGTENFSFKGHHGRYLSCDKLGVLTAQTEAVSPLESFLTFPTASTPETFQIQNLRDQYITIAAPAKNSAVPQLRGDAADVSFNTTLRIRMQARFKPRLKRGKEDKAKEKISRKELEEAVGRKLEDDEVRKLKRARREGNYHEALLDVKVKSKHDKYS